ncbi:MAG: hypothetical protein Q9227_008957 [Pyrenula ochraceoflavens]
MSSLSILIIGGGLSGLSAALSLRAHSPHHHITLLESSSWLRETGAAVLVPPNACRALRHLGFDLHALRGARFMNALDYHDVDVVKPRFGEGGNGVEYPWAERGRGEGDFYLAHRVDYHEALRRACVNMEGREEWGPPVEVRLKSRVVGWESAADSGVVTLEDGTVLKADLVVAADGVRSQAHRQVLGYEVPAVPSGTTNIRFLLETEVLREDPVTREILEDGEGVFSAYRSADRRVYVRRYPCRSNTLQNFGVYKLASSNPASGTGIKESTTSEDTKSSPHSSMTNGTTTSQVSVSKSQLQDLLASFPPSLSSISSHLPDNEPLYLWTLADRTPLPNYHASRLVLIGDAAHPMWSFQGQGAAQSVEDGAVLGTLLSNFRRFADDDDGQRKKCRELERRLELYSELRVLRTGVAQLLSRNPPQEEYVAENVSKKIRRLLRESGKAPKGEGKIDAMTTALRFVERLDGKYKSSDDAKGGGGEGEVQLATHDDISDFFWEYDSVQDAGEVVKRLSR